MEFKIHRGYLGLFGPEINQIAQKWIDLYLVEHQEEKIKHSLENRIKRDGNDFHLTVITPQEFKEIKSTFELPDSKRTPSIYDLGIGRQTKNGESCHYIVIYSVDLQNLRKKYGLPNKDFHITIGFSDQDIHDVSKSPCSIKYQKNMASVLAKIVENDPNPVFIKKLFDGDFLVGLYYQAKSSLKEKGVRQTYTFLANKLQSKKKFKELPGGDKYGIKMCKVMNHNIKAGWEKFVKFWTYQVNDSQEYIFSFIKMPRNFSYISDNLIGSSILNKKEYFEALNGMNVTDVITLMEQPLDKSLYQDFTSLRYHFFNVDDMTPPTMDQTKQIMEIIDNGSLTVIHCQGGVGRTGTALAAYLMHSQEKSRSEAKEILEQRKTILSPTQDKFLNDWYTYCSSKPRDQLTAKFPRVLMMVGYPSSGKSTFSKAIEEASSTVSRINQDEQGRKACLDQVGSLAKKKGTLILDRCNLTKDERKEWLDLSHRQKAWCIFFDVPINECKWRIVRRKNHPSIKEGGGARIIDSVAGKLEPPTIDEGFEKIITIRTFDEANSYLKEWNCQIPEDTLIEDRLVKFPRTRHVQNLGAATRDDLIMDKSEVAEFLNRPIYVEEKIDGANMGFSIKDGNIIAQNRSHYVNSSYHPQFKYLDKWIYSHTADLWQILESETRILYGEWVYAKHSINYQDLPDWFVAFDLYDRVEEKFWSRKRLEKHLEGTSIKLIPLVADGETFKKPEELRALTERQSYFNDSPVEGVYLRICDDNWLIQRGKIVRHDFVAGITGHWLKAELIPNRIDPSISEK